MAFKLPTMTRETSTTTLTGDMVMAGAQTGYFAASAGLSNADTTFLTFKMGSDCEEGLYTYNSGANSFTRTQIYRSTNANAAVSWSAGTKDVICGLVGPSDLDDNGRANFRNTIFAAPFDALAYNGMQINGSMEVSQEKGTTLWTPASTNYLLDGLRLHFAGTMVLQSQQVTDAPPGFNNSLKITVTTAESSLGASDYVNLRIPFEGVRVSRLALGNAAAQPIAFGFWVKVHRTGTYSGAINNSAFTRSYPFTFVVNSADTWEFKTVTLSGDTSGTWLTAVNTVGLYLNIAIAAGSSFQGAAGAWAGTTYLGASGTTNGVAATSDVFQFTGLIGLPGIELPSSARSALIMRPFDDSLDLCSRFFEKSYPYATNPGAFTANDGSGVVCSLPSNEVEATFQFRKRKPATPTLTTYDTAGTAGKVSYFLAGWQNGGTLAVSIPTENQFIFDFALASASYVQFGWKADARL